MTETLQSAGPVAEIVTFRLNAGVSDTEFVDAAKTTEGFVQRSQGFRTRRLSRNPDGTWTDYVEWANMASAQAAAQALGQDPDVAPFLAAIDMDTVTMRHETILWHMGAYAPD